MKLYAFQIAETETVQRELPWTPCTQSQVNRKPDAIGKFSVCFLWDLPHLAGQVVLAESHSVAKRLWEGWKRREGLAPGKVARIRQKAAEDLKMLKCPYCGVSSVRECLT